MPVQMHSIEIDSTDGDICHHWKTRINGTHASVVEYYFNKPFNIGHDGDLIVEVTAITFSDGIRVARCPNPQAYELIRPRQAKVVNCFGCILDMLDEGE